MEDLELIRGLATISRTIGKVLENRSIGDSQRADLAAVAQLAGWLNRRVEKQRPEEQAYLARLAELEARALAATGAAPVEPRLGHARHNGPMLVGSEAPSGGISLSSPMYVLARRAGELGPEAAAILEQFAAQEESYLGLVDAAAAGGVLSAFFRASSDAKQADAAEEIIPTVPALTDYLKRRFPDELGICATEVRQLPGGFGKTTVIFTVAGSDRYAGDLVMRKDMPVVPVNTLAIDEFAPLSLAWERGIPVPEPLWSESDAELFGGTFIVVRKVEGSNDVSAWRGDPVACRSFAEDLAAAMAKIHTIRPADLGIAGIRATASEAQDRHVYWIEELYRASVREPNPRIEAAFGWLLRNAPPDDGRPPSLVHAGIGFHNMLSTPGRLTSILDWEVAHFGHPGDDLGYTKQFVTQLLPWEEFMTMYRAHGGAEFTPEQDSYFAVWRNLRNACFCTAVTKTFLSGHFDSVRLAIGGMIHGPRFEIEMLRQIAAR